MQLSPEMRKNRYKKVFMGNYVHEIGFDSIHLNISFLFVGGKAFFLVAESIR
jgi:hypothetical protein